MIEKIIGILGFREEEVKTYLSLLDFGACSGAELSRRVGMKKPTMYGYLDRLVRGGLATESSQNGVKLYVPATLEQVQQIFQRRQAELRTTEKEFLEMVPELRRRMGISLTQPKIQKFEGQDGIQNAMGDLLQYGGIEACIIWPIKSMLDVLTPEYLRYHNMVRIQNKISYRSIWERNQGEEISIPNYLGTGERYLRDIKLAPNNFHFDMGIQIYANKVVFLSSRAESFALMIESQEIVDLQLAQFNTIWDIAQKFEIMPKGAELFFEDFS